jgi:hypothetical protein
MPGAEILPENGYSYVREEVKALSWIRRAIDETDKIHDPFIAPGDPQRIHKTVELYTVLGNVSDDYTCAESLLAPFKDSKNEMIHGSVDALLTAIGITKQVNADLTSMIESLNKATKPEDIDQTAIGKTFATMKGVQKDVRQMTMLAVKLSTYGILAMEGKGDDTHPVAFTITEKQHAKLLAEVRELVKTKGQSGTYVDVCAEILLTSLNLKLPMSGESHDNGQK